VTSEGTGRRRQIASDPVVVPTHFFPPADRRSVLDRAHRGDIIGALGRVPSFDTDPRVSKRRRIATLLAVLGPGVVVLVADNDAGGISTYAQVGQDYGLRFLWLLVVLAGVLLVNQEMVGRLGAVTGAGHARLIYERFGRRWGTFALGDLLVLNLLVIVTEFIGVAFGLAYFGVSRYISVPLAASTLLALTATGSFRRWERAMGVLVAVSFLSVPLVAAVYHHPAAHVSMLPVHQSGPTSAALLVVALIGTTVAPWQLFFQQSYVVDKRITPRWLRYERADTAIGTVCFALGAVAVLVVCSMAFSGTTFHGAFVDAGSVATALHHRVGSWAGALFAVLLLDGSILGAAAVTLATSYAVGEVAGTKHSMHRRWRDAPTFHGSYALVVVLAAAVVLIPGAPLGIVTIGVQALAGVLLPSALVFLLLLCNDEAVLGPWVNARWLNTTATAVVGVLLAVSGLLTVTTLLPGLDVSPTVTVITAAVASVVGAVLGLRMPGRRAPISFERTCWEAATWTMPAIESLPPPAQSRVRTIGLWVLRSYLLIAAAAVAIKVIRLT
jgi:Mn2+/Fe2+ NRAMP family transporter